MQKNLLYNLLLVLSLGTLTFVVSCGDEEEVEPKSEQNGNQNGNNNGNNNGEQNDNNGEGNGEAPAVENIVVTIDAEGKADGGHRFKKIDDTNFYIDDIKYTAKSGDLVVSGFDDAFFKGEAKLISQLNYDGREMVVKAIGNSAFYNCNVLTSINIPGCVTSIGPSAFYECSELTSISISDGVISIGNSAFYGCSKLISVTIPESVTSIESSAFSNCSGLTSISISDGVTSIGNSAFKNCSKLISVTIPESVTSIGSFAFEGCSELTSISISDGVTSIGSCAFYGCIGLTSVTIPESVTSIEKNTFSGCSSLKSVYINCPDVRSWFSNNSSIESVFWGNSVKNIYAFSDCSALTTITIPNSVTCIESSVFRGCDNLKEINIIISDPNGWSDQFGNLPRTVTHHLYNLNKDGEEITNLVLSESLSSIPNYAFSHCSSLTSITIPNSVTNIGQNAFRECSVLTSITIPNSVTSIGHDAFAGCTSLSSVTIPEGVTNIGYQAFVGCSGLKDVYCYAERAPSASKSIIDHYNDITLHVPAASLDAYKSTSPWSLFGSIVAIEE